MKKIILLIVLIFISHILTDFIFTAGLGIRNKWILGIMRGIVVSGSLFVGNILIFKYKIKN